MRLEDAVAALRAQNVKVPYTVANIARDKSLFDKGIVEIWTAKCGCSYRSPIESLETTCKHGNEMQRSWSYKNSALAALQAK